MTRRWARRTALVALGLGFVAMAPVGPRSDPAGAAVTIAIPDGIDATGSRDVTGELNAFLATVPAGATVTFPDHGRFDVEGIVLVSGAKNVTIEGHGSTLVAKTDGRGGPPPFYNYRSHWPRLREHVEIRDSESVIVKDLAVEGPNRDGSFHADLEGQAAFVVSRSRRVTLDGVTARATYGDGVYVTGGSVDVTVRRCTLDHNGRQGVAVVDGDNITVERCDIRATARSVIDLEPGHGLVRTVHVHDNRVDGYTNFLLAAVGAGVGVQDVWLEKNEVTGGRGVSVYVGTERSTRSGIHVIDNRGAGTSAGLEGVLMRFTRFDGIEVRGNRQRIQAGVTPIVLHNSCNATVSGNDFGGVVPAEVVKSDGDCTTGPQARVQPPTSIARGPRGPRGPGLPRTSRPRIGRPSTTTTGAQGVRAADGHGSSTGAVVIAVGLGALAGAGATLLVQRLRRTRPR